MLGLLVVASGSAIVDNAWAQSPSGGLHKDPVTGDIYRSVTYKHTRPVVDEHVERKDTVVYRPETIKETRPEVHDSYTPVTEIKWMPYLQNRWNPFRPPTVAYKQVPETRWEKRSEVIHRTTTKTQWIAENRTVEIPHRTVRYETTHQSGLELVARGQPHPAVGSNVAPDVVARLQPMESTTQNFTPTGIASNSVGSRASDSPIRGQMQSGMRTNVLQPAPGTGLPIQPTSGIATVPNQSIYR